MIRIIDELLKRNIAFFLLLFTYDVFTEFMQLNLDLFILSST